MIVIPQSPSSEPRTLGTLLKNSLRKSPRGYSRKARRAPYEGRSGANDDTQPDRSGREGVEIQGIMADSLARSLRSERKVRSEYSSRDRPVRELTANHRSSLTRSPRSSTENDDLCAPTTVLPSSSSSFAFSPVPSLPPPPTWKNPGSPSTKGDNRGKRGGWEGGNEETATGRKGRTR